MGRGVVLFCVLKMKIRSEGSSETEEGADLSKHLAKFNVRDRERNVWK